MVFWQKEYTVIMNEENISTQPIANQVIDNPKPIKKKHKFLKFLIIFIILIASVGLLVGFLLPGLLWTKGLGIEYTRADYESAVKKLDFVKDAVPTGDTAGEYTYTYGELRPVSTDLTSAEITAFINYDRPSYYAVKNVQVKINTDGTVETSGSVNVDYILTEVLGGKYSKSEIQKEIPALGFLPSSVNLYVKTGGSVVNNTSSVNVDAVKVQGISIPSELVKSQEAVSVVNTGVNNLIDQYSKKSGATFENISTKNEKLIIKGNFPSSLNRTKK